MALLVFSNSAWNIIGLGRLGRGGLFLWKILVFQGRFWSTFRAASTEILVPMGSPLSELHFHIKISANIDMLQPVVIDRKVVSKIFRLWANILGTQIKPRAVKFCTHLNPTSNLKGAKIQLRGY